MTRFSKLTSWQARLVLAVTGALIIYGVLCPRHKDPQNDPKPGEVRLTLYHRIQHLFFPTRDDPPKKDKKEGDAVLYRRIVERVHAGENYYLVTGAELRQRNYATRPFVNWRLPSLALLMGALPNIACSMALFGILAALTVRAWARLLVREISLGQAMSGIFLQAGAVVPGFISMDVLFHEHWAGVLIGLSLAAYARGWRWGSVALGLAALLIRELALPYVLIMLAMAAWERRPREVLAWLGVVVIFSGYLAAHAWVVSRYMTPADQANEGWLQLGGWPFVLYTAQMNGIFCCFPKWLLAIVLPLALLGLVAWRAPIAVRVALTAWAYVLAFLVVGRACNGYWGWLYAPLIPLGVPFIAPALADLWHAGRRPAGGHGAREQSLAGVGADARPRGEGSDA